MSSGEWEVVGAYKKTKSSNGSAAAEKKSNSTKADSKPSSKPVIRAKDGTRSLQKFKIKLEQNNEEEEDDQFFKDVTPAPTKSQKSSKKSGPAKPKTLKDAITKLNLSELQSLCKGLRAQFSEQPLIWLKDLASFLNIRLNPVTPVDSAYRQEPSSSAPLDYVSKPIREFLTRMVQNTGVSVTGGFHRHCFVSMLHEAMRGLPVHGFAIFIQIISSVNRDACVVHASDYIGFREMYDTHPRPGLTYVWLMSQTIAAAASAKHYTTAVNMWMEGLLPLVTSKQYSSLSVQCGKEMVSKMEGLQQAVNISGRTTPPPQPASAAGKKSKQTLNGTNKQTTANGTKPASKLPVILTCEQLERLLDITFAPVTQIPRPINKQLVDIFNKLKVLCGSSSEGSAVFTRLLPRLVPSCSPAMAQQISSTCGYCLHGNESKCWNIFQQMVTQHMIPSAKLLKLLASDEACAKVLETASAQTAFQHFDEVVEKKQHDSSAARELSRELQRTKASVSESMESKRRAAAAAAVQRRSGRSSSSTGGFLSQLFALLVWSLLIFAGVGYGSVLLHDHWTCFESSMLGELTDKAGVTEHLKVAVTNMAVFYRTTASTTVSQWQHVLEVVKPYLTVVQARAAAAAQWLSTSYPGAASVVADVAEKVGAAAGAGWAAASPYVTAVLQRITELVSSEEGTKSKA